MSAKMSLDQWAKLRGHKACAGDVQALSAAREEVRRIDDQCLLDADFRARRLAWFRYAGFEDIPGAETLVLAAVPRPAHIIAFETESETFEALLPPTYLNYTRLPEEVGADLRAAVLPEGARISPLAAPLKLLAAHLGLVRYGLNNISYVAGMGSYFQLVGFITDSALPLPAGCRPRQPEIMPQCEACLACRSVCPTSAIPEDRFLLRAELCVAFLSEELDKALPQQQTPGRSCLYGCMLCQEGCPENCGLLQIEHSGVTFDRQETHALLSLESESASGLPDTARLKLQALGLLEEASLVARNLRWLLRGRR